MGTVIPSGAPTSLVGSAHAINRGNTVTLSGQLVGNGQALAGLPVTVHRRVGALDSWQEVTTLTTTRDGAIPVVIVNRGATRGDDLATLRIDAGCSQTLRTLTDRL